MLHAWHLLLCSVSVDDIDIDSIVSKLVEKIFGSVLGLYKYKHRRLETLQHAEQINNVQSAHHHSFNAHSVPSKTQNITHPPLTVFHVRQFHRFSISLRLR